MPLSSRGFDGKWLEYSYVGAPWWNACPHTRQLHLPGTPPSKYAGDSHGIQLLYPECVGNGGLSFRRRSAMLEVTRTLQLHSAFVKLPADHPLKPRKVVAVNGVPIHNEDVFFAVALKLLGRKVAPRDEAVHFSVECVAPLTLPIRSFIACGLHKTYMYQHHDVIRVLCESSELEREVRETPHSVPPPVPVETPERPSQGTTTSSAP
jgi:hypothetical protein